MRSKILSKRSALVASLLAVAALAAAAIGAAIGREAPAALGRAAGTPDALPRGAQGLGMLKAGESRRVAEFSAAGGPRAVYLTRTEDGKLVCVWDTDLMTGAQGGGCNDASDFFGGRAFTVSLAYDGGPAAGSIANARLVGVVTEAVSNLDVIYSSGRHARLAISADRGFAYVVPDDYLKSGIEPIAVAAYDGSGTEIDRQSIEIGR